METIGAFDAKTHLSALLDRVAKGEKLTITRHGIPAAVLVPIAQTGAKLSHKGNCGWHPIASQVREARQDERQGNDQ